MFKLVSALIIGLLIGLAIGGVIVPAPKPPHLTAGFAFIECGTTTVAGSLINSDGSVQLIDADHGHDKYPTAKSFADQLMKLPEKNVFVIQACGGVNT